MNLSELVALKNLLLKISTTDLVTQVNLLDARVTSVECLPMHADYKDQLSTVLNHITSIEEHIEHIDNIIPDIITTIKSEINTAASKFYSRGYTINGFSGSNKTDAYTERNNRKLLINDTTRADIVNLIREKTDWKFPALEIGPGDGEWTGYLVAADPLYLLDIHQEFLDSTTGKFNEFYRRRLRPYLIGDSVDKSDFDLSILPVNQFGFIFSWNVFNYFPEYETKLMLSQCYELLRPGGSMIFSYNNCDLTSCAEFAEQGFRSWMTEEILVKLCKEIGFDIIKHVSPEETFSWIEIKKPGTLKTVKAHQVLGKIISRNA